MKKQVLALALSVVLLVGCSPEPRGPVEVLGKTFFSKRGSEFSFENKDTVKVINLTTGESTDLKYTLQGDKLTILADKYTLNFQRSGQSYYDSANHFEIAELTDADKPLIAKFKVDGERQKEEKKRLSPDGAPSDSASYVADKTISDENNDWATWIAMAWNADVQDDETRLGVLSKAWYGTNDSFARQAVKEKELARIKDKLSQLRKIEYVAITRAPHPLTNSFLVSIDTNSGYDFAKKGFRLITNFCGSGITAQNRSGASVEFTSSDKGPFCYLPVSDENDARKIEALRVSGTLFKVGATVYAKIAEVDDQNRIKLVPIGIDYTISRETYQPKDPGETYLTVSHWPYK